MKIVKSDTQDLEEIFRPYKLATDYQKTQSAVAWPEFDKNLVQTEITEQRQWKIIIDGKISCIWATTFSDPQIWEERNNDQADIFTASPPIQILRVEIW